MNTGIWHKLNQKMMLAQQQMAILGFDIQTSFRDTFVEVNGIMRSVLQKYNFSIDFHLIWMSMVWSLPFDFCISYCVECNFPYIYYRFHKNILCLETFDIFLLSLLSLFWVAFVFFERQWKLKVKTLHVDHNILFTKMTNLRETNGGYLCGSHSIRE